MQRVPISALVFYDEADRNAVSPLLETLQNLRCLAGHPPNKAQLSKRWRDAVRTLIEKATVGVFIVSESSLRSPTCMWLLESVSDRQIKVVLLFASPVPLADLHRKLKFPNIDWTQSRSLPRSLDSREIQQLLTSFAEPLQRRRRRHLTKRQILRWVGANAISPPGMTSDQMVTQYPVGSSKQAPTRTLSIAELRQKRIDALPRAITHYMRVDREDAASAQRERVDCSVYAPPSIHVEQPFKMQALLHLQDDLEKATVKAEGEDPDTRRLTTDTLQVEIRRGARVELSMECPELQVRNPRKSVQWQGQPKDAVWDAVCPATTSKLIRPKLLATVNGIPVGHLEFDLQVASGHFDSANLDWKRARARAYRKAFISYSRADFERVSYYAEMADCAGIELLFDLTSLEPGDDWADWIKTSIPIADVFFLMWSKNAAASDWVDRESCLAMRTNTLQGNPDVKPILLERPTPRPPKYLRHLHFSTKYVNQRIAERNPLFT